MDLLIGIIAAAIIGSIGGVISYWFFKGPRPPKRDRGKELMELIGDMIEFERRLAELKHKHDEMERTLNDLSKPPQDS